MVFSDALFLYLFLPLTLASYFVTPNRWKNSSLLLASLFFYAAGERKYVAIMLASITLNFLLGRWISRCQDDGRKTQQSPVVVAVVANIGMLVVFKYANFLVENLNVLLSLVSVPTLSLPSVHLPIGISFFTFQAMSYVIDVHRGETKSQKNIFDLALYIALFPQLIAGPIVRYATVADQITNRKITVTLFSEGVQRFIFGLSKKMILANPAGRTADLIFNLPSSELSSPVSWLGLICYTIQIYFDFSGYSDMAIGLGKMFGFTFDENFNYPYVSQSLTEFWRRWHISLSTWFRDYLYIPLGGSRNSATSTYRNLLIVFVLCGLWHGASWNFFIWGLIHGAFLILERGSVGGIVHKMFRPMRHVYVMVIVMLGWVFFRAETLSAATAYLHALAGLNPVVQRAETVHYFLSTELLLVIFLALFASTSWPSRLVRWNNSSRLELVKLSIFSGLWLICSMYIAAGTYNPFIYFRF